MLNLQALGTERCRHDRDTIRESLQDLDPSPAAESQRNEDDVCLR